jgi:spore maturation protein CgeB
MNQPYDIVILGLSITSSWGNGHATTFRSLVKGLSARGQRVLFLERDQPWYAANRDLEDCPYCDVRLYSSLEQLREQYASTVARAGAVIVGSYVPDGIEVSAWVLQAARGVRAFYDIDTPVTVAALQRGDCPYVTPELVREFDVYLSFAAGPLLQHVQTRFGARRAVPLYCSVDVDEYRPLTQACSVDLGYMGTYSPDRQPKLQALLLDVARALPAQRFVVAGAQYPADIAWPLNVRQVEHLPPAEHRRFYGSQRYTLNLTRADMVDSGYSPSVRLFEAAACGVPIISDDWAGLTDIFEADEEILVARESSDVIDVLQSVPEARRLEIAGSARRRVLAAHSGVQRARELQAHLENARTQRPDRVVTA